MSYSSTDFHSDLLNRFAFLGLVEVDDIEDNAAEEAARCLAALEALHAKVGVPENSKEVNIVIPDDVWQETGPEGCDDSDGKARLLSSFHLSINGTAMHIEAFAVSKSCGLSGEQRFDEPEYFGEQESAFYLMMGDCAALTTTINGREYVLVVTPHGD